MPRFILEYEPDMPPRMAHQVAIDTIGRDLDGIVVEKKNIHELADWTLALFHKVYMGAERLGPINKEGGAVIFIGDTGEMLIKQVR